MSHIDIMFNLCNIVLMSRLSIEIDPEQHRQIKTLATFEGMSIKEFILNRTLSTQKKEKKDTTSKLLSSSKNKDRLLSAIQTPSSASTTFESVDDLKNALGI